eukprot:jgi/Mesen1/4562/ME000232S03815
MAENLHDIPEGYDIHGREGTEDADVADDETEEHEPTTAASSGRSTEVIEPFMGMKARRRSSVHKVFKGDYINLASNHSILKLLTKQGDKAVLFADGVVKVNRHNRVVKRLLVITDAAIYVLETETYRQKRRIGLQLLETLCLSELNDNFFALIVPTEYDYLLASTRKTEIVTVLVEAVKLIGSELNVMFTNTFEYCIDSETSRRVSFAEADGGISTKIFSD